MLYYIYVEAHLPWLHLAKPMGRTLKTFSEADILGTLVLELHSENPFLKQTFYIPILAGYPPTHPSSLKLLERWVSNLDGWPLEVVNFSFLSY